MMSKHNYNPLSLFFNTIGTIEFPNSTFSIQHSTLSEITPLPRQMRLVWS
jgi:hypothetical protein